MKKVNPYLTFNGNCEAAFDFYKSVFGGEFSQIARFGDMPGQEMPESAKNKIMHVSFPISNETILMGSDTNEQIIFGKHISLSVAVDTKEEATKIFNALAAGGKTTMPIADTFWGAYFGMLEDKFGFAWMVNYDYPKK